MKISAEAAGLIIDGFVNNFTNRRLVIAPDLADAELAEVMNFLEIVGMVMRPARSLPTDEVADGSA